MADRVLVMYAGQMIEQAPVLELFDHPAHPLHQGPPALRARDNGPEGPRVLESIEGMVPEQYDMITGCRFADRCLTEGISAAGPRQTR